jgi:hypothetical protein
MPTRPDASSAPQRQSVRLIAAAAVLGLAATAAFGLIAVTAPDGVPLQRWLAGVLSAVAFAVALRTHRRLRRIRWNSLVRQN